MLFGVIKDKNSLGTKACSDSTPVIVVTKILRQKLPNLMIMLDVCLCEYTDHGHCGHLKIVQTENELLINNGSSIDFLAEIALKYAQSGAHWVCPSDMMDGRVKKIREILDLNGFNHVGIMSYTSKKASTMYSPFRFAVDSSFKGNRKQYQQPIGSTLHSLQALRRDEQEGATALIVKPALFYGDIIKRYSEQSVLPIACYIVSGDYVMLKDYAKRSGDLKGIVIESHISMLRAGASILITYFTPFILEEILQNNS